MIQPRLSKLLDRLALRSILPKSNPGWAIACTPKEGEETRGPAIKASGAVQLTPANWLRARYRKAA